jgi:dihydroflavonol-4-reductase
LEFIADHVTRRPPSGTAEGVRSHCGRRRYRSKKRSVSWATRPGPLSPRCGRPLLTFLAPDNRI